MKDIVHNYDIEDFKIGDEVYGDDYTGKRHQGTIFKMDFTCEYKLRFGIEDTKGQCHWLRIVNFI